MVKDPHQPKLPWYWRLMRALLLAPIILVVAGICLVLLVVVTPLGIVGVFLLAQFVAWLVRTIRRRRAMLILGYVEQAVRMNLPLSPMLDAAAASESGVLAYRLKALSYRLRCGEPLALALRLLRLERLGLGPAGGALRLRRAAGATARGSDPRLGGSRSRGAKGLLRRDGALLGPERR